MPCDICEPGAEYLRDVELAALMRDLVDRELVVTLVLDCCHGGGVVRGTRGGMLPENAVVRGLRGVGSPRPLGSALASRKAELIEIWREEQGPGMVRTVRGVSARSWLPESRAYALLAACTQDELALELPFENGERHGVLTHGLLQTLRAQGAGLCCQELYERVLAGVHGQFPTQTPLFRGRPRRSFFGGETGSGRGRSAVTVMRLDPELGVLLNTGQSQDVQEGDRFAVTVGARKVLLEVRRVGATESWATTVLAKAPIAAIEPGVQATRAGCGPLRLRRGIALERRDLPAAAGQESALERVSRAFAQRAQGLVHLASSGEAADFRVAVNDSGDYEILDSEGRRLPNVRSLPSSGSGSAAKLVQQLEHLTRFRNIEQLRNPTPDPSIADAIELRFSGMDPSVSRLDLRAGEATTLLIVNQSSYSLNVVVLDLRPDASIAQICPKPGGFAFSTLSPQEWKSLQIKVSLPPEYREGDDVLKVFATRGAVSFRWLELPPLGLAGPPVVAKRGASKGPLEELFAMMGGHRPAKRKLTPSEFPEEEWITRQVTIHVQAAEPVSAPLAK